MSDVALILLAAGGSSRLGTPKQLIDVDGEPLVRRMARQLVDLSAGPVGVVIGGSADLVAAALDGLPMDRVVNDQWSRGLGTSIHAAVRWAQDREAAWLLITLCDQPDVDAGHLRSLLAIRSGSDIVASNYGGQLGVPAIFAAAVFERLLALPDDRGAKGLIRDPALRVAAVRCAAATVDLDTPDDVARWRSTRGR